jgi:hypothetical protein
MIESVKKCPFCGNNVSFRMIGDYPNGDPVPAIVCTNCKIIVKYYDDKLNTKQIIAAWNRRYCTVLDTENNDPVCLQVIPTKALVKELQRREDQGVIAFDSSDGDVSVNVQGGKIWVGNMVMEDPGVINTQKDIPD